MKYLLYLSFILFVYSDNSDYETEHNKNSQICKSIDNKDICLNKDLQSSIFVCCMAIIQYDDEEAQDLDSFCTISEKANLEIFHDKRLSILYKEVDGYESSKKGSLKQEGDTHYKYEYYCKDGNYTLDSNLFTYTQEEIEILSSKEHCLYYHDQAINEQITASDSLCQNGKLNKFATDEGFKCGYFDITFNLKDGNTENLKTCYIISKVDIKSGTLNYSTKKLLDEYAYRISNGYNDVTYTIEISSGDDISASYNSKDERLTDHKNESDMIKVSKYLTLLFLILI
jgi:hypothetical protein